MNTPIDFWFINNVLDPITQRFQKFTGLDCFWLAKIPLWLSIVVFYFLHLPFMIFLATSQLKWFLILLIPVITEEIFIEKRHRHDLFCRYCGGLDALRDEINKFVSHGQKNPLALYRRRRFIFSSVVFLSFETVSLARGMSFASILYPLIMAPVFLDYVSESFQACTPLPPSKSTLRKWFDGVASLIQKSSTPSLPPQPA